MDIGVLMFPTDLAIQPTELAKACEERGFESLWFPEHSHIQTSRKSPWNANPDLGPLPEEYWRAHDQFVALSADATHKLRSQIKPSKGSVGSSFGALSRIRTCGLPLRRRSLYPTELPGRRRWAMVSVH